MRPWRATIFVLGSIALVTGAVTTPCSAQTTQSARIRSEAREVVLPVWVVREQKDPKGLVLGPNGEKLPVWIHSTEEVTGLSSKSFHVFEDGVEQRIRHFSVQAVSAWPVKDNVGEHTDFSWTPSAIWSPPDMQEAAGCQYHNFEKPFSTQTYLISYIPPASPVGSCHRIALKVAKRHAEIFAPDQYCNKKDPLSDPLSGTAEDNKLLQFANSEQTNAIPLTLQVSAFSGYSGRSRVSVSAEFPASFLKREWKANHLLLSVAILGLVYDSNHALVARFSDTVCPPPECKLWYDGPIPPDNASLPFIQGAEDCLAKSVVPSSYRTQLELEPGDYEIQLVITDGEKFGRAHASISADDFRKNQLAISGIALATRYHTPLPDERGPTRAPQYVPLMFKGEEFTPAGDTRFRSSDRVMAYFEIYNNSESKIAADPKLYVELRVLDSSSGEMKVDTGLRPAENTSSNSVTPVVWTLAVDKLPAGTYRLQAQASDSEGHKTEWRESAFTIE